MELSNHINLGKGVKYRHNSLVIQQREEKMMSVKDLLQRRKISKTEFNKVTEQSESYSLRKVRTEQRLPTIEQSRNTRPVKRYRESINVMSE